MSTQDIARVARLWGFVGSKVRDRRKAVGFSAETCAKLARLTVQALYNIEDGTATPNMATACNLASVLDCTPNDFCITRDLSDEAR